MTTWMCALALCAAVGTEQTTDYAAAYKAHVDGGRPLVVLVGADWCPACRTMKTSSIPSAKKNGAFDKVAFATVNVDQQRELARELMSGGSIPQLIVYYQTDHGAERMQLTGAQSPDAIAKLIDKALAEAPAAVTARQVGSR